MLRDYPASWKSKERDAVLGAVIQRPLIRDALLLEPDLLKVLLLARMVPCTDHAMGQYYIRFADFKSLFSCYVGYTARNRALSDSNYYDTFHRAVRELMPEIEGERVLDGYDATERLLDTRPKVPRKEPRTLDVEAIVGVDPQVASDREWLHNLDVGNHAHA